MTLSASPQGVLHRHRTSAGCPVDAGVGADHAGRRTADAAGTRRWRPTRAGWCRGPSCTTAGRDPLDGRANVRARRWRRIGDQSTCRPHRTDDALGDRLGGGLPGRVRVAFLDGAAALEAAGSAALLEPRIRCLVPRGARCAAPAVSTSGRRGGGPPTTSVALRDTPQPAGRRGDQRQRSGPRTTGRRVLVLTLTVQQGLARARRSPTRDAPRPSRQAPAVPHSVVHDLLGGVVPQRARRSRRVPATRHSRARPAGRPPHGARALLLDLVWDSGQWSSRSTGSSTRGQTRSSATPCGRTEVTLGARRPAGAAAGPPAPAGHFFDQIMTALGPPAVPPRLPVLRTSQDVIRTRSPGDHVRMTLSAVPQSKISLSQDSLRFFWYLPGLV